MKFGQAVPADYDMSKESTAVSALDNVKVNGQWVTIGAPDAETFFRLGRSRRLYWSQADLLKHLNGMLGDLEQSRFNFFGLSSVAGVPFN